MQKLLQALIISIWLLGSAQAAVENQLKLDYGPALAPPAPSQPLVLAMNDITNLPVAPLRLEYQLLGYIERMSDMVMQIQQIIESIPIPVDKALLTKKSDTMLPPLAEYHNAVGETLARIERIETLISDISRIIRDLPASANQNPTISSRNHDPLLAVTPYRPRRKGPGILENFVLLAPLLLLLAGISWWWLRKPGRQTPDVRQKSKYQLPSAINVSTPVAVVPSSSPVLPRVSTAPATSANIRPESPQPISISPAQASRGQPLGFEAASPHKDAPEEPREEEPGKASQALELAEIMVSMGLTEGAARTLVEQIQLNPKRALPHWLKLLDIYRKSGMKEQFDQSAKELHTRFNVHVGDWQKAGQKAPYETLESYPRILAQVQAMWGQPDCIEYLTSLLEDNRGGTRAGFPAAVAEEILLLISLQ
jgi:hypothetical protein